MWPVAEPKDIEERWRPLSPAERVVAGARIKDAEDELQMQLSEYGVTAPSDDPRWIRRYKRTVADMVRRYLLNPDAWESESTQVDDYMKTRRRDSAVASGLLFVSDQELEALLPRKRRKRGAFTIRLGQT